MGLQVWTDSYSGVSSSISYVYRTSGPRSKSCNRMGSHRQQHGMINYHTLATTRGAPTSSCLRLSAAAILNFPKLLALFWALVRTALRHNSASASRDTAVIGHNY